MGISYLFYVCSAQFADSLHIAIMSKKQKLRITYVIRNFCLIWYARLDSNQRPTESESVTLSN